MTGPVVPIPLPRFSVTRVDLDAVDFPKLACLPQSIQDLILDEAAVVAALPTEEARGERLEDFRAAIKRAFIDDPALLGFTRHAPLELVVLEAVAQSFGYMALVMKAAGDLGDTDGNGGTA